MDKTHERPAIRGMVRERVAIIRKAFEAWRTDRWDLLAHHVHEAVQVDWSESLAPYRGVYCGHSGWRALFAEMKAPFTAVCSEADDFVVAGQNIAVPNTAHMWGRDGLEVISRSTIVFTFLGVKIVALRLFQSEDDALAAIGA